MQNHIWDPTQLLFQLVPYMELCSIYEQDQLLLLTYVSSQEKSESYIPPPSDWASLLERQQSRFLNVKETRHIWRESKWDSSRAVPTLRHGPSLTTSSSTNTASRSGLATRNSEHRRRTGGWVGRTLPSILRQCECALSPENKPSLSLRGSWFASLSVSVPCG